ncbi:hypothetical protein [Marinobacterium aestuariivivens]|uniref:Leucine-binding protein domain-containing protein n=1 Tax=Marinobacterium aestuariivivens TaxID=1698799 RepID=A0ABW2A792_9GAMM
MPYSSRPQASAEYRGIGRRRLLLGSALGTASVLLGRTDPSFASELPLRIGFVGPFTGPAQDTGLEIRRGC